MTEMVFYRILEGLRAFSPVPLAFFGGMGESLLHPRIMEMTAKIKTLGARVELITNGTLLTPEMTHGLLDAVVDMLWVSLDGATSETYYRSVDTSTSI